MLAGEESYSCDVCGMKFASQSNFKKHEMVHTTENPFSCNLSLCHRFAIFRSWWLWGSNRSAIGVVEGLSSAR